MYDRQVVCSTKSRDIEMFFRGLKVFIRLTLGFGRNCSNNQIIFDVETC